MKDIPSAARNTNILEELGQIQYLLSGMFSIIVLNIKSYILDYKYQISKIFYIILISFLDKTGTLTNNEMIFSKCTLAGLVYGPAQVSITLLSF